MTDYGPRRSGRTTRLADKLIQELFETGVIIIKDHYDTRQADEELYHKITRRLQQEHPGVRTECKWSNLKVWITNFKKEFDGSLES